MAEEHYSWIRCSDGTLIAKGVEGFYFVLTKDDRPAINSCPICRQLLRTIDAAQHVVKQIAS
jgi:hypothetical protein